MTTGNGDDNGRPPQRPQGNRPPPLPQEQQPRPRLDNVRPNEQRTMPPGSRGHAPPLRMAPPPSAGPRRAAQAGRPRAAHAPRESSTAWTVTWMTLTGIGVLAAIGVAYVVIAPPVDFIRQQAVAAVKKETGRDLVIRGPASFTFYPHIGVSLQDVSLSAPPGMGGAPTVAMQRLDVAVKLMPLIEKRVEVRQLVLTKPAFYLRIDKSGRASWDMAFLAAEPQPVRYAEAVTTATLRDTGGAAIVLAQAGTSAGSGGKAARAPIDDLALDDVRIVAGKLDYSDERNGTRHSLASIDASVSAPKLTSPLKAKGDLDWQGQSIEFDGTLSTLAGLLQEKRAKVSLEVKSRPLDATYTGAVDTSAGTSLDGNVTANSPSLRALAQWLGHALPQNDGFGPLALSGRIKSAPDSITLDNADVTLDGARAVGRIAATLGAARPQVKADLKIAELNLNTYIGSAGGGAAPAAASPVKAAPTTARPAAAAPPAAAPPAVAPPAAAPDTAPRSIEELLERQSGPRVKGYTARSGWSDEPIDVAMLDLVDADAKLSVGKLIARDVTIGQSDLVLALKNRVARTTFERVQLYEGTGRGTATLDASTATPKLAANIVVDGIAAAPLLKDTASIDWLSGRGKLTLAITAEGTTQRQLVSRLAGRAEAAFTDGAITGFNVGKVVRGLGQGKLTGLQQSAAEKTDFSQLSATFDIVDGIATNQDLTLLSPLLRVTGAGRVMMPERQIDYLVKPKLVSEASGQGGALDLGGIEVPVKITGSWDRPSFAPDLSKIDAGQAAKAVEQIGKSLKGKNAGEIVDDLFGKDSKEGQKAKKLIDQLFR